MLSRDGVEINLEELVQKNLCGYDGKGKSENVLIETLQNRISRMGFRNGLI